MFKASPILDVVDLKRRLIYAWSGLQQHVIDETIDQWRGRLRTCVRTVRCLIVNVTNR